jgi:2-phospho-L-lactate guanylyltransferase
MAEVLIAVRGGLDAKSRSLIEPRHRGALVEAMLTDMLQAIGRAASVTAVHVVTPTPEIADLAGAFGAGVLLEERSAGLNAAFSFARERIALRAPQATLVVLPGDLPGLDPAELEAVIACRAEGSMVLVPAARDGGTGALALRADVNFPFAYGPMSFERHMTLARAQGLEPRVMAQPSLADDLDRPADLRAWLAAGRHGATATLLAGLDLAREAVA